MKKNIVLPMDIAFKMKSLGFPQHYDHTEYGEWIYDLWYDKNGKLFECPFDDIKELDSVAYATPEYILNHWLYIEYGIEYIVTFNGNYTYEISIYSNLGAEKPFRVIQGKAASTYAEAKLCVVKHCLELLENSDSL